MKKVLTNSAGRPYVIKDGRPTLISTKAARAAGWEAPTKPRPRSRKPTAAKQAAKAAKATKARTTKRGRR